MDFSANNTTVWNPVIQLCIIAIFILGANIIRRKVPLIRKSLMPTAVLAGFLLLAVRLTGILRVDVNFLEALTYHFIAIGFIALSLRVPRLREDRANHHTGLKSGAIIVSTYLIQAIVGIAVATGLSHTLLPDLFKPSGLLLALGFGQGPGQANNTGSMYETSWGFAGGRSFGLSLAAAGYVCACVVGVIALNILYRRKKFHRVNHDELSGSITVDMFQSESEIPISESVDRFSIQVALVISIYLVTYLATKFLTGMLSAYAPGIGATINGVLWGFNFIIGSAFASVARAILAGLNKRGIVKHQYQNHYLLSRISGAAFDIMIVAGIGSIKPADIKGLWLPFVLMALLGAAITYLHLAFVCKRVYGDYYYEGFISMYGMLTGTISSGILLLREIDPDMKTPAANNLVIGSSFAILLGAPMLAFIGIAPKSDLILLLVFVCCIAYYAALLFVAMRKRRDQKASENRA